MILLSINRLKLRAMRTGEETMSAATDRLHIGNRWINHAGLGYYDNTARYFDALTVRFIAADSHERKNYQGTTLLVGGRNKEITFYYRNTIVGTIPINELKRITCPK